MRWATDRIGNRGIVAFVTNNGWITGNTTDGLRLALAEECSALYVFNLRGNQRLTDWRKEGGKIFGEGSQTGVAIFVAVKNPDSAIACQIHYRDIGDSLSREEKLAAVAGADLESTDWRQITPNAHGDWIEQRDPTFSSYTPISVKKGVSETAVFTDYSGGLKTNRDAWVYNFSADLLAENISKTVDFYNEQLDEFQAKLSKDPDITPEKAISYDDTRISWSSGLVPKVRRGQRLSYDSQRCRVSMYRPYCKMRVYFDADLNDRQGRLQRIFPSSDLTNFGFFVPNPGNLAPAFMCLMTDTMPDLGAAGISAVNFYPRWVYLLSTVGICGRG